MAATSGRAALLRTPLEQQVSDVPVSDVLVKDSEVKEVEEVVMHTAAA